MLRIKFLPHSEYKEKEGEGGEKKMGKREMSGKKMKCLEKRGEKWVKVGRFFNLRGGGGIF